MVDAYDEEEVAGRERTVLRLHPRLAPVKVAVLPLVSQGRACPRRRARSTRSCARVIPAEFDEGGSIGKRYRRQDEIGTPWGVTIDGQTMEDDTVTLRDRDSLEQVRVPIAGLADELAAPAAPGVALARSSSLEDRSRRRGGRRATCCRCWRATAVSTAWIPGPGSWRGWCTIAGTSARGRTVIARDDADEPPGSRPSTGRGAPSSATGSGCSHDLFVRPEHRQHGVGRALINACLERARERGVARLGWDTEPGNSVAQRLYDSLPGVSAANGLPTRSTSPSGRGSDLPGQPSNTRRDDAAQPESSRVMCVIAGSSQITGGIPIKEERR